MRAATEDDLLRAHAAMIERRSPDCAAVVTLEGPGVRDVERFPVTDRTPPAEPPTPPAA